jgi:hypothetical protein
MQNVVDQVAHNPDALLKFRLDRAEHWRRRAEQLQPQALAEIRRHPDVHIKKLLMHGAQELPDDAPLGTFVHFPLWKELFQAVDYQDVSLIPSLYHGFKIIGEVEMSRVWSPFSTAGDEKLTQQQLEDRAWDFRRRTVQGVLKRGLDEHSKKIWDDTIEEVKAGFTVGPFFKDKEVQDFVNSEAWIPTPRFAVVQKEKVRGVDGATSSGVNLATIVSEKLQLTSTDANVALIRALTKARQQPDLGAWVLDEAKAYRQIPVHPSHRKFAVIVLLDPASGRPGFFVMIGHSFGWISAVYNYNRRSRFVDTILVKEFQLAASCFYDDKFGFEAAPLLEPAFDVV